MPDRRDENRILEGKVTGTASSDVAIARELERRADEYYALTGKRITVKPLSNVPPETQVLKPGTFTKVGTQPDSNPVSTISDVIVNFEEYPTNPSKVGRDLVAQRQQKRAA